MSQNHRVYDILTATVNEVTAKYIRTRQTSIKTPRLDKITKWQHKLQSLNLRIQQQLGETGVTEDDTSSLQKGAFTTILSFHELFTHEKYI